MPKPSANRNVMKVCRCKDWKTCDHPWYINFTIAKQRYRPNLDLLIGSHCRTFRSAELAARREIASWLDSLARPYLLAKEIVLSGKPRYS